MRKGVFIAGTDTEIGKTAVACYLIRCLNLRGIDCGVMKPVQCAGSDAKKLAKCAGVTDSLDLVNPFFSKYAYAPLTAFKKEKIRFNKDRVIKLYNKLYQRHQFMVVEGAGGFVVPITKNYFISDLILDLNLPVLIVAPTGLGTINHTLLTIEYARKKNIKILGIIFNTLSKNIGIPERTNPGIIKQISHIPVLGVIPYLVDAQKVRSNLIKVNIDINRIIND